MLADSIIGGNVGSMATGWTFLTTHGLVLLAIARDPQATQREIGDVVGVTERTASKVIGELVEAGYLTRFREGRRNRYELNVDTRLRHALSRDREVRDLVGLLTGHDVSSS